jgi:hypothetical protein
MSRKERRERTEKRSKENEGRGWDARSHIWRTGRSPSGLCRMPWMLVLNQLPSSQRDQPASTRVYGVQEHTTLGEWSMCAQATHAAQIARRERTQGGKKDRKHKGGELTQSDTSSGSAAARVLLPALFLCVSRSRLRKASLFESNNKKNCRLKRELDSTDCFGEWGGHRPVEERTIRSRGQGSREVHCDARREAPEVWWRPQIANQHTVENVRPRHGSSQRHVILEIRQGERE